MALTRQRESAEVFVAKETARDAGQLARQMARGEVRAASIAWPTRQELTAERKQEARQEEQGRQVRDALTWSTRQRGTLNQVRGVLSPAGRELLDAMGGKIDREMRGSEAERHQVKLQAARELADKEVREGPVDPVHVRRQVIAWETQAQAQAKARHAEQARKAEAERAPAPLVPAWRDPTGQGLDSLGRGLDAGSVLRAVQGDGAVQREQGALGQYLRGAYQDPAAAHAALEAAIRRDGRDHVGREVGRDPGQFGELRGKVGWFASGQAKGERVMAVRAAGALPDALRRVGETEENARQRYVRGVEEQQGRDETEVPGLSKAALAVLEGVRAAQHGTGQAEGERRDAWQRRQEEAVTSAWTGGRADPRVAGELDRFMAAAGQRLGEEGVRTALRAASGAGELTLPGVGREHRAGLAQVAQHLRSGLDGKTLGQAWERRTEREAQEAERLRVRAEERERRGLPPEPEQDRERQRQGRGLGLGR